MNLMAAMAIAGTLCINQHIEWLDQPTNSNIDETMLEMTMIGAHVIRTTPSDKIMDDYDKLCSNNFQIIWTMQVNNEDLQSVLDQRISVVKQVEQAHPGCTLAFTGANEPNNPSSGQKFGGVYIGDANNPAAPQDDLATLANAVKGDPALAKIDIVNLSVWSPGDPRYQQNLGDMRPKGVTHGDWHAYLGGSTPTNAVSNGIAQAQSNVPSSDVYFTETGACTDSPGPPGAPIWCNLDRDVEAVVLPKLWMASAAAKVKAACLYELTNLGPSWGHPEGYFGLFDENFQPKPVAYSLMRLSQILGEGKRFNVQDLATVPVGAANMVITGAPFKQGYQKTSSGAVGAVLWREDNGSGQVTVNLPNGTEWKAYDPNLDNGTPASNGLPAPVASGQGDTATVTLADHIIVVEFGGKDLAPYTPVMTPPPTDTGSTVVAQATPTTTTDVASTPTSSSSSTATGQGQSTAPPPPAVQPVTPTVQQPAQPAQPTQSGAAQPQTGGSTQSSLLQTLEADIQSLQQQIAAIEQEILSDYNKLFSLIGGSGSSP